MGHDYLPVPMRRGRDDGGEYGERKKEKVTYYLRPGEGKRVTPLRATKETERFGKGGGHVVITRREKKGRIFGADFRKEERTDGGSFG